MGVPFFNLDTIYFRIIKLFAFLETLSDAVPTIGFSKFITKYKGIVINIYDLGGSSKIREIWHNYFAEVMILKIFN